MINVIKRSRNEEFITALFQVEEKCTLCIQCAMLNAANKLTGKLYWWWSMRFFV